MSGKEINRRAVARYKKRHPDRVKATRRRGMAKELSRYQKLRANLVTWPKAAIANIRFRARKEGREFTITAADLRVPTHCPVLGIPLKAGRGCGKHLHGSPSVDRFDNSRGYTPDNVRVISARANALKRDATVNELRLIIAYMEGFL